ncbi:Retrovirus-related Pol polyprotein from transposon TNT 1-94 [Cardamine amara subsp. amara]|uniref:Retrovirus-related Pol polyprotein from transposon TNT 1-94 n=1 Tax=Cardamine amara subsp. amara TaxID=228776 RepID=A0ABD0ZU54_CARAN
MYVMSVKIDKFFGRNSFSFRPVLGIWSDEYQTTDLVQWFFGSMGDLVQWAIMSMICSIPVMSIWPVLGIWSDKYQTIDIVTDNQASRLLASGSSELGHRKNRNKTLFSMGLNADGICNYCKEKGHWKFECPKKKQSGYDAVAEDDIKSEQDVALVAGGNTHAFDVWVLDTGASYHMCPRREWFETYTIVDGGNIKMANSSVSKVAGIGSIKIRTHDGRFVTLNDVRHVPSMEKNLISVSLLDSRGFQYSGGDGVLKVYQGSDVILKGFMRGTLYILQGSTVSGSVNVASA